jgi:hypothetical protein
MQMSYALSIYLSSLILVLHDGLWRGLLDHRKGKFLPSYCDIQQEYQAPQPEPYQKTWACINSVGKKLHGEDWFVRMMKWV